MKTSLLGCHRFSFAGGKIVYEKCDVSGVES